jgi:type IV pilus assembly protein PilQ
MNLFGKIKRHFAMLAALCFVPVLGWTQQSTPASAPQNSIDSLQVSQQQGMTIVKLTMKQALSAPPASFSIASPARVAFDFAGTENGLGRNVQQLNEGELRSVNIVQVGDRTRLVLNLNKLMTYETRIDGANLYINLVPASVASESADASQVSHFATGKLQEASQNVRDINFRRGKDGEARILVDLSDPNVGIDIQKQGVNLIVVFRKTTLPDNLNRRLDVTDFATPVTAINTQMQGENVQMTITPHGLWEHNAYQSDNQFVIEVRPVAENPNKLVQGSGTEGEKLSLNFQNIDVRSVLQVIADFTNFNIITSDTVAGNVTLRLKDVPWDQALDIILQSKGLGMRKNGNVIWIAPDKEIIDRDEYQSRSRQASSLAEPMQTQTFRLSFAKAEDVMKLLSGQQTKTAATSTTSTGAPPPSSSVAHEIGNYLSQSGAVTLDARTNQLFVTDFPSYLERVRKLIAQVDKPVKQVLIEARIVSAEDNFGRSLGARLGYNDLTSTVPGLGVGSPVHGSSTFATVGGSLEGVFAQTGQTTGGGKASGTAPTLTQSTFVNLPAGSQGGAAPSSIAVSLFKSGLASFINLELSAAETDGRVKGISSPRVLTADGQQALISQGVDVPYTTLSSTGMPSTSFRTAVLKLSVTPQITTDGTVILDLDVSQDTVGTIYSSGVSINTRNIKTRASVENGGTIVLGGIFEQSENDTTNQVPFLGDLPVVGNLFKSNTKTRDKKELLVFITPRIIDEQVQAMVR